VLTLVCSIVPLLVVGWGLNIPYARFAKTRIIDSFKDSVANHSSFIEQFLQKQSSNTATNKKAVHRDFPRAPPSFKDHWLPIGRFRLSVSFPFQKTDPAPG
jgi:hypothetical protein